MAPEADDQKRHAPETSKAAPFTPPEPKTAESKAAEATASERLSESDMQDEYEVLRSMLMEMATEMPKSQIHVSMPRAMLAKSQIHVSMPRAMLATDGSSWQQLRDSMANGDRWQQMSEDEWRQMATAARQYEPS